MKTINAQDLLDAYNGKYKYVTQSRYGLVYLWEKKPVLADGNSKWACIILGNYDICIGRPAITEFQDKNWTECIYKAKPSEEDWVGTLCWFWNDDERCKDIGTLEDINTDNVYSYVMEEGLGRYAYCRPVRPDEIKFFNNDTSEE